MVSKLRSVIILFYFILNRSSYGVDNNCQGHLKFKKRSMDRCIPQYISPISIKQIKLYIVIVQHNKNKTVIISQEIGELFVELMFLRCMSQHNIICEVVLFQQWWLGVEDPTKAVVKGVEFQTC